MTKIRGGRTKIKNIAGPKSLGTSQLRKSPNRMVQSNSINRTIGTRGVSPINRRI